MKEENSYNIDALCTYLHNINGCFYRGVFRFDKELLKPFYYIYNKYNRDEVYLLYVENTNFTSLQKAMLDQHPELFL